jgi:hypothetical protein
MLSVGKFKLSDIGGLFTERNEESVMLSVGKLELSENEESFD